MSEETKISDVIPWGANVWGVAIDLPNGRHVAYQVGTKAVRRQTI